MKGRASCDGLDRLPTCVWSLVLRPRGDPLLRELALHQPRASPFPYSLSLAAAPFPADPASLPTWSPLAPVGCMLASPACPCSLFMQLLLKEFFFFLSFFLMIYRTKKKKGAPLRPCE